jgi:hypothetical protein
MVNHEASGRRSKALVLVWPILLAICVTAATGQGEPSAQGGPSPNAAAGAATFTLGLDAAFPADSFRGDARDALVAARPPLPAIAPLTLGDVRAVATAMRQEQTPASPSSDPAKSDGGFGRWLKRHWWVPALVGAAVLVTAGESLYDDDDDDDED